MKITFKVVCEIPADMEYLVEEIRARIIEQVAGHRTERRLASSCTVERSIMDTVVVDREWKL